MSDYRQITDNFLAKRLDGLSRSDRRLVLRLLFACFIVLALFISLEIGGYLISTSRIDASAKNARLIEVSGNQRILTQQIAILAFTLVVAESDSLRDDIRSHINKHISGMKRNHQRLLSQDEELGLGAGLSPKAEALLISGDPSLDDEIKKYLQHAKALLSKEKQPGFSDKDFQHITSATTRIAERLEALTKQFRKDSVGAIADFDRRSFSVLIATAVLSAITMIGVFLPVVRRLKRELQRRASIEAQLTQSNKELDSFTGIVAHDLRGPLRTINGFSHLLLQNPGQNEVSEYANHIASASKRMDSLLSSLMRYAKSTSQSEAPELVSIEDLLSEIRHDLAFEFECARAEVATENLPTILGYKTQLRQLFQNLVQNSLKYKKSDVPCEIKVHAHNRSKQRGCTIIIEDNGIGFGSQDISHIFEPFRRLNENGDKEGSGVGLAICKKIVSNHQGSISAKRKGTSGAEFLITFPKRRVNLPETV